MLTLDWEIPSAPAAPEGDDSGAKEPTVLSQEVLELAAAAKSGDLKAVAQLVQIERSWFGPLPPPEIFRDYPDDVQTAITENWRVESDHRRGLTRRGQIIGTIIALASMGTAAVVAIMGQPWVGASIVVSTMIGIALTGVIRIFPSRR